LVIGTEDEYISTAQVAEQQLSLRQQGANATLVTFAGKHELNRAVLEQLSQASSR
jgi:predicted esterase